MATKKTPALRGPIDWPLVALIAVVLTAAIAALRVLGITAEKLAEVTPEQWLLTASIIGGAAGTLYASFRGHVLGRSSVPVRGRETLPPPSGEEGSVALGLLMWIVLAGGALVLGSLLTGCGGGILATHARAATIALVSIQGAQRVLEAGHRDELAACPDPACVADVDRRWISAGVALDAALPVVGAWIGTLEIAELAGTPDAELESVLELAMARAQDVWRQARDALDVVGLELPDIGGAR